MTVRSLLGLRHDERGASLIELALAAPFMAAIVIGMTDLSRAYSMKLILEQASQRAVEKVENQRSVNTAGYNTDLTTEATSAMTAAGYSTGNTYTPDSWVECSSDSGGTWTKQPNFSDPCPNASDLTARYVTMRVSRNFVPMFTSRVWPGANADGTITLSGFAEVRMQ
jgi:Flp pilus assembly protein TadG